jgi:predicted enzyme related to lactoylglutathione lyase
MPATFPGAPCWVDVMSSDTARSSAFYSTLFGWHAEEPAPEYGGYFNFSRNGALVAGCMAKPANNPMPDTWTVYLQSADTRTAVAAAEARGSTILAPAMDVGELGTMAVVTDPGGAVIGIWQPAGHAGFDVTDQPGTPVWFEVFTRDYGAAVAFYRDVFLWQTHVMGDTPEFHYTTLGDGERQAAGIMDASAFLPDGVPASWSVYFRVTDTDAALGTVTDNGGGVIRPAEDTPYGRMATVSDPMGAIFKLISTA